MGRSRFRVFTREIPYFVTSSLACRIPLFNDPMYAEILLDSIKYYRNQLKASLYCYVIMPDHIHMILECHDPSIFMQRFKSFTANKVVEKMTIQGRLELLKKFAEVKRRHKKDCTYQIWHEGYHPIAIDSEIKFFRIVNYIHYNPLKAGLVKKPSDWLYSSARNYEGLRAILDIDYLG